MRDDLFAETRSTNEDCDFAYVLPCRCGKFKSILHRFVWITALRNVHTQQRVHKVVKLNLVSAYVKKIYLYNIQIKLKSLKNLIIMLKKSNKIKQTKYTDRLTSRPAKLLVVVPYKRTLLWGSCTMVSVEHCLEEQISTTCPF